LAVPLFALFSAGVAISGGALSTVFTRPETLGVILGLVIGKAVGVLGGTWLGTRFTRTTLNPDLAWADIAALASLAGVGFTVSLLIGELAFAADPVLSEEVEAARARRLADLGADLLGAAAAAAAAAAAHQLTPGDTTGRVAAIHEATSAERGLAGRQRTARGGSGASDGDRGRA
jgi:Na+/H+ antiporter NhaA